MVINTLKQIGNEPYGVWHKFASLIASVGMPAF